MSFGWYGTTDSVASPHTGLTQSLPIGLWLSSFACAFLKRNRKLLTTILTALFYRGTSVTPVWRFPRRTHRGPWDPKPFLIIYTNIIYSPVCLRRCPPCIPKGIKIIYKKFHKPNGVKNSKNAKISFAGVTWTPVCPPRVKCARTLMFSALTNTNGNTLTWPFF